MSVGVVSQVPRRNPSTPRLQLQTSRMGAILMGKNIFRRAKFLEKLVHTMETGVLNIQTPVRITPSSPTLQHKTLWMGAILKGKMIFRRAKLFMQ